MFQFLLTFINSTVQQLENAITKTDSRLSDAKDSHEVAAIALELAGLNPATAYAAMPKMHARTVRRLTVRMDMVSLSLTQEQEHTDSSESVAVIVEIQKEAERAKVRPAIATAAVTRYLNAPERVMQALKDIQALQQAGCRVWNPTGLFTRSMRSGEAIKLPASVTAKREYEAERKAEQAAKPKPEPGVLVKLYGEVCPIIERLSANVVLVRTKLDDIRVNVDALRFHIPTP